MLRRLKPAWPAARGTRRRDRILGRALFLVLTAVFLASLGAGFSFLN